MKKTVLGLEVLGGEISVTQNRVCAYYTHAHVYHEMLFYDAFDGAVTVNQTRVTADVPLLILVTPTDFHSTTVRTAGTAQYLKIAFRDDFTGSAFPGRLRQPRVLRDFPRFPLIAALRDRMAAEAGARQPEDSCAVPILLNAILLTLTESGNVPDPIPKRGPELLVLQAMQQINARFAEELPLTAVAAALNVTPQYLSTVFSACAGVPYSVYLRDKRLRYAAALLAAGDGNVTEICYRCGFANLSHFIRSFEARYHDAPRAWQKKNRHA